MSQYLLLRNNKQSGPFSLDEVRAMGLKAYDLLWVEGKSAAWRYPSEIEELKAFAPVVEEQPFDRFFKKPVSENKAANPAQSASNKTEEYAAAVAYQTTTAREPIIQANRPIYVTLPAKKTIAEEIAIPERKTFVQERPKTEEQPKQKPAARPLPLAEDEFTTVEDKFSQPANNNYTNSSSVESNRQAAQTIRSKKSSVPGLYRLVRPAAMAFGLIALIALGIVIGLLISNSGNNSTKKYIPETESVVPGQQAVYKTRQLPPSSQLPVHKTDQAGENNPDLQTDQPANRNNEPVAEKKKPKAARLAASDSLPAAKPAVAENKDAEALTTHRETAQKADVPDAKEAIRNNILDYVSLSASKYTVGTFGGISDLQITVSNNSAYPLELVVVEVKYIQSNKKNFKTENIYFHDIGAAAALMQEAPKSSRGIKVQYRISLINSKELGLSYSDL